MSDIKASEVVGEVKKMVRTFEAMEKAARIIEVLADAEKRERETEANIKRLKELEVSVSKSLDEAYNELDRVQHDIKTGKDSAKAIIADAKDQANDLVGAAKSKAQKVIEDATSYVTSMENAKVTATANKQIAERALRETEEALVKLRTDYKQEKQRIIDSLGA